MGSDKSFDTLLNKYNILLAQTRDLKEQLKNSQEKNQQLLSKFDVVEKNVRELCEDILAKDPKELHNAVNDKKYKKLLTGMRAEMIRHLSERGEEFVKDGQLVVRKKTMLYGPNYPKEKQ